MSKKARLNMKSIDKKKCADLLRDMCDQREKEPHYADIRTEVFNIRKFANALWPKGKNACSLVQWDALKAGLKWNGTPDELEAGLVELRRRNQETENRKEETGKVEIAY